MSIGPVQFECAKHFVDLLRPNTGYLGQSSVRESVATMARGNQPDRSSSPVGVPGRPHEA